MTQSDSKLRNDAMDIFRAAVARVQPDQCIPQMVKRKGNTLEINGLHYNLTHFDNIYVIAFGKASVGMFQSIEQILSDKLTAGIVITNSLPSELHNRSGEQLKFFEGSHPFPTEKNVNATRQVIELCESATDDDLVLFLISGGGSALLCSPKPDIPFEGYRSLVDNLMKKGATINELNQVRIALSQVKGGRLLGYLDDATVINLIISDVIGDPPEYIASGPTVQPDVDTYTQRQTFPVAILDKYELHRKYAKWIDPLLEQGKKPSPSDIEPETFFVGSNRLALLAAKRKAKELGYAPIVITSMLSGEASKIGEVLSTILIECVESSNPSATPCCILSGGETTVTVRGEGKGGRNQELALGAAEHLRDLGAGLLLSAGTDGIDGPTDAAGAIVDSSTALRAARMGLSIKDALHENNSYQFFKSLNDLVITGPTGTNVMDIQIGLVD